MGSLRTRFPAATKTASATAGARGGTADSPIPVGSAALRHNVAFYIQSIIDPENTDTRMIRYQRDGAEQLGLAPISR